MTPKLIYTILFFAGIFGSGFWLSRLGSPYNTLVFTLHKFVGLGIGIFLVRAAVLTQRIAPLSGVQITILAITVLLFIAAVAAGGALSAMSAPPLLLKTSHKFLPYAIVPVTAAVVYWVLI